MFDFGVVQAIENLAVYGLTIVALTAILKNFLQKSIFKTTANFVGYIASAISSVAFTLFYLISNSMFTLPHLIGYSILVCLSANLIFKSVHKSGG